MARTDGSLESEAATKAKKAKKRSQKRRAAVGKGGKPVSTYFSITGGAATGVGGGTAGGINAQAARPAADGSGSSAGGGAAEAGSAGASSETLKSLHRGAPAAGAVPSRPEGSAGGGRTDVGDVVVEAGKRRAAAPPEQGEDTLNPKP